MFKINVEYSLIFSCELAETIRVLGKPIEIYVLTFCALGSDPAEVNFALHILGFSKIEYKSRTNNYSGMRQNALFKLFRPIEFCVFG